MMGFHLPGDPYFPNQENNWWLEANPEENHEIPLDNDLVEQLPEETDSEPEVENLPQVAPIPNPNPQLVLEVPTPMWVGRLDRWSRDQRQPRP